MNIFENMALCAKDFSYFVESSAKVVHPIKGLIPFTIHNYQKNLIQTYENNRFVLVKKFRNGGFTTTTLFYGLWKCLFQENQKWLIISKTDREAVDIGNSLQRMFEHLPESIQALMTHKSDHVKTFGLTNSSMSFQSAQAMSPKGITHCVFDETAFIPNMEYHWRKAWPHLINDGKAFFVSTVNGTRNWFYQTWDDADHNRNRMKLFEAHYSEHPDYQNEDEYVEELKKSLGQAGWDQEMACIFVDHPLSPEDEILKKKQLLIKLINELFDSKI